MRFQFTIRDLLRWTVWVAILAFLVKLTPLPEWFGWTAISIPLAIIAIILGYWVQRILNKMRAARTRTIETFKQAAPGPPPPNPLE